MREIPVSKCLQIAIEENISMSCMVALDINQNGVENIVLGSSSGTVRVIRIDGNTSNIKPLVRIGRLACLTVHYRENNLAHPVVFASTVDGTCGIIHVKQMGGDGNECLVLDGKMDICLNCRVMKIFHEQKDYAVLGTEDGVLYVYEILQNTLQTVGSISLSGSIVDISRGDGVENSLLHLFVSCEGGSSYEVELHTKSQKDSPPLISREIPKHDATTELSYGHICWYYSKDHHYCNCGTIRKCIRVVIPAIVRNNLSTSKTALLFILHENGDLIMQNQQDQQYKLSIIETIVDFNVQLILDNNRMPRLILMCRDANFFSFYTDILSYFRS